MGVTLFLRLMDTNSVSLSDKFITFPSRSPSCFTKSVYAFRDIEKTWPADPMDACCLYTSFLTKSHGKGTYKILYVDLRASLISLNSFSSLATIFMLFQSCSKHMLVSSSVSIWYSLKSDFGTDQGVRCLMIKGLAHTLSASLGFIT